MGNLALMNLSKMAPEILETRQAKLDRNRTRKGNTELWEDLGSPVEEAQEKSAPKRKPLLTVNWG